MRPRVIICRCEDISEDEILAAIKRGYTHIEELKRYTGFGTGFCQGKLCHARAAIMLEEVTGQKPQPFTSRPPISPTPLKVLAGEEP